MAKLAIKSIFATILFLSVAVTASGENEPWITYHIKKAQSEDVYLAKFGAGFSPSEFRVTDKEHYYASLKYFDSAGLQNSKVTIYRGGAVICEIDVPLVIVADIGGVIIDTNNEIPPVNTNNQYCSIDATYNSRQVEATVKLIYQGSD